MPVYSGSFPVVADGLTATVRVGSTTLGTQVVTGDPDVNGAIPFSYTYADGDDGTSLIASVSSSLLGTLTTQLLLNTTDSIANQPGASETAYLIATGILGLTDSEDTVVVLEADPRYGDLPEWVTVVGGEGVLDVEAGGCVVSLVGQTDFDFSDAPSVPDDPGTITGSYTLKRDGSQEFFIVNTALGNGDELQSGPVCPVHGDLVFGGTLSVVVIADATTDGVSDSILDAAASHNVAVNITRVAPAPTLP